MKRTLLLIRFSLFTLLAANFLGAKVLANGGPFIIQHPGGDPAAKGVLARHQGGFDD